MASGVHACPEGTSAWDRMLAETLLEVAAAHGKPLEAFCSSPNNVAQSASRQASPSAASSAGLEGTMPHSPLMSQQQEQQPQQAPDSSPLRYAMPSPAGVPDEAFSARVHTNSQKLPDRAEALRNMQKTDVLAAPLGNRFNDAPPQSSASARGQKSAEFAMDQQAAEPKISLNGIPADSQISETAVQPVVCSQGHAAYNGHSQEIMADMPAAADDLTSASPKKRAVGDQSRHAPDHSVRQWRMGSPAVAPLSAGLHVSSSPPELPLTGPRNESSLPDLPAERCAPVNQQSDAPGMLGQSLLAERTFDAAGEQSDTAEQFAQHGGTRGPASALPQAYSVPDSHPAQQQLKLTRGGSTSGADVDDQTANPDAEGLTGSASRPVMHATAAGQDAKPEIQDAASSSQQLAADVHEISGPSRPLEDKETSYASVTHQAEGASSAHAEHSGQVSAICDPDISSPCKSKIRGAIGCLLPIEKDCGTCTVCSASAMISRCIGKLRTIAVHLSGIPIQKFVLIRAE